MTALLTELAEIRVRKPVLYVDTRVPHDYAMGHIPGAIHLDTFDFTNVDTSEAALPGLLRAWHAMFLAAGVTSQETVVFYDAGTENRCARPAFMLAAVGHTDVHVLHGGMMAWIEAVGETCRKSITRPPSTSTDLPFEPRSGSQGRLVGADGVKAVLGSEEAVLLDVRPGAEFAGRARVQENPRLGHIPGARSLEWERLLKRRPDAPAQVGTPRRGTGLLERFRPWDEIMAELRAVGIESEQDRVIVYCQKSHRASNTFLALERLGFVHAKVYIGSFREWCRSRGVVER